ncbi:replication initiation protein, partial (plasmid) [Thiomicrospira sp. R3]
INLRQQFTQYFLEDVLKFKSEYTWRIYEMCMSVKSQREPVLILSVEEFRERLCIPESYRFINVRRVIENSIAEIEEKTDYTVTVGMKKKGRAFNRLDFKIVKKQQQQLNLS